MVFWCIVLALLLLVLWIRDEMRKAPTLRDDSLNSQGYTIENYVPKTRQETDEYLKACGIEPGFSKDYTKDEKFCQENPCDYMKPYRFPNGKLTYVCTNVGLWEGIGIKEKVLQGLNEGANEMCCRCCGLPCRGERKKL